MEFRQFVRENRAHVNISIFLVILLFATIIFTIYVAQDRESELITQNENSISSVDLDPNTYDQLDQELEQLEPEDENDNSIQTVSIQDPLITAESIRPDSSWQDYNFRGGIFDEISTEIPALSPVDYIAEDSAISITVEDSGTSLNAKVGTGIVVSADWTKVASSINAIVVPSFGGGNVQNYDAYIEGTFSDLQQNEAVTLYLFTDYSDINGNKVGILVTLPTRFVVDELENSQLYKLQPEVDQYAIDSTFSAISEMKLDFIDGFNESEAENWTASQYTSIGYTFSIKYPGDDFIVENTDILTVKNDIPPNTPDFSANEIQFIDSESYEKLISNLESIEETRTYVIEGQSLQFNGFSRENGEKSHNYFISQVRDGLYLIVSEGSLKADNGNSLDVVVPLDKDRSIVEAVLNHLEITESPDPVVDESEE